MTWSIIILSLSLWYACICVCMFMYFFISEFVCVCVCVCDAIFMYLEVFYSWFPSCFFYLFIVAEFIVFFCFFFIFPMINMTFLCVSPMFVVLHCHGDFILALCICYTVTWLGFNFFKYNFVFLSFCFFT